MPQYMLLLRDDRESWNKLGPDEMQRVMERYLEWRSRPYVVDGRRLHEESGRVMHKKNGSVSVTDGPFAESREVLGGYYTIEAESFEAALEFARDHPHVDFGTIEIREVFPAPAKVTAA